jgi:hypothetical protein
MPAMFYLLLLVNCDMFKIAQPQMGSFKLLSVYQTQSGNGKYGATEVDIG